MRQGEAAASGFAGGTQRRPERQRDTEGNA